ncbi:MAG TPA: hypothetical protein VFY65_00140 [Longimicrobium sp.]|nr:hypothetical protein [Longimicrobium sp.]
MRKLRLEIEEIRVESFEAHEQAPARGTVNGHEPTLYETCSCDCSGQGQICTMYPWPCTDGSCVATQCLDDC